MIPDCRVTVYDKTAQTVQILDAISNGDFGRGLIKYEDTPSGCGAGQLQLGLRWEEVVARGYYTGMNVVEISTADNTLQQGVTTNQYPNSDSLSGSTLSGLTLASGGPGGATDAEYTGTGSAVGSLLYALRKVSVTMGQTYVGSWWVDPSQITNNNGAQFQFGFNTADNLQAILVQNLPSTATTAGRYATSAWTCPTNLAPHSDDFNGWTSDPNGTGALTVASTGPGGATSLSYSGAGGAGDFHGDISPIINVTPGQTLSFSAWANASSVTSGNIAWYVTDSARTTNLVTLSWSAADGSSRKSSASFIVPAGMTQLILRANVNAASISGSVAFSQPMLEPKSSASGYYISSQNPQVQVFAQLLSSAIVTNGQKFKISQPMLEAKSSASPYYVPYVTDGSTRLYLDSKEGFDSANGEDIQQAYLWDGGTLTMRIPVTGVGIDGASQQPYITCGTPLAGGGNPTSIAAYGLGTYVGRRRYAGRILRRRRPNQRMPLATVDLTGLSKAFDQADGQTFTVTNIDVGTVIYNVLAQFTARWPHLTISAGNFPTLGVNYSGSRQNASVTQMLTDIMSAISSGDLWVVRVGHDRTPRLIKLYTSGSNTYTYNRTLPQGVAEFEPQNVTTDDQDVSNLFNSIMVIGDTDPATKQPVAAIVQDSNSISTYGQVDAQPVTNTALKTVNACVAYATALLNQSSLAVAQNQFKVYLRNDNTAANRPAGLSNGDVVRGIECVTISRFNAQGTTLNAVPDSEFLYSGTNPALWTTAGSGSSISLGTGPGGSNVWRVAGTGAALNVYQYSDYLDVVVGQMVVLSGWVNASQCSSSAPGWFIYDFSSGSLGPKLFTLTQTLGASGTISGSYQIPSGVTKIAVMSWTNNTVVPNGQYVSFSQPQLLVGSSVANSYVANYATPNIYGLAASVQTTIDAHGDRWQDVKFAAIEPDWNADVAERANALATAMRSNTKTPIAIDSYVVSTDAFPSGGIPTTGLTVNPPTFLALFASGTAIQTVSGATFTLPATQTSWAWLNSNLTWTIKQDPTLVAGAILYAIFTTSASAVIGQTPKAPIGVMRIGVGNVNVAGNMAAPTCSSITVANASTPTTLAADISAALTVTNVPQDGSVYALAYYFRQTGTTTWIPYGELTLPGLPQPAASIAMLPFIFGQLQNGISYDFAVGFAGLGGYGPLTTIKTALTANSIVVTTPYLIGTTSPTPTVTSVTVTNGTSANGVAAAVRLQFTLTNQPTDGSLSRISVWFRVNGATAWTFYTNLGVPGLPNPSASQAYDITLADLTNGQNYDFAVSYENAQGQDSATFGSISTNWTAQALNLPTSALPKIPSSTTVSVASVTVNSYSGTQGGATIANVTYTPTVTPPAGDNRPFTQWGAGYLYWAKVNDSGTSDGDTNVLNYFQVGSYAQNTSGSAVTDNFGPLGAGHAYQLAIQPMDQQGNPGPLAIVGLTSAQYVGNAGMQSMPSAVKTNGPTISSSSYTARTAGRGIRQIVTVTFTETDFTSLPSWIDGIWIQTRINGTTTPGDGKRIDPNSSSSGTYNSSPIFCAAGDNVDVGIYYTDQKGQQSATVWPAALQSISDPNGDMFDSGDGYYGIPWRRAPVAHRNVIDSSSNVLNVEFPGGKLQPNGSLTNVDGASSHTAFAVTTGTILSASIAVVRSTGNASGLILGSKTNGVGIEWYNNNTWGIVKWVSGTYSSVASGSLTADGNQHIYRLSVTTGSSYTYEANIDGARLTFTDPSPPALIGSGALGCIVETAGVAGTLTQFDYASGNTHYSTQSPEYQGNFDSGGYLKKSTTLNNQGSVPPIAIGGVSAAGSYPNAGTPTVTISWSAQTINLPDGSTVSISAGSQAFANKTANTTYHYGVYADSAGTIHILGDYGANTAPSQTQKFAVYLDGRIPISEDCYCTTPSSVGGSTGGGGGGGGSCPAVWQLIETKERGKIRAEELQVGMHIPGPGDWVRITDLLKVPAPIWRYSLTNRETEESFDVNDSHALMDESGTWVKVRDVRAGQRLRGKDEILTVVSAEYLRDDFYISLEVEGHVYYMGDALVHNPITL